MSKKQLIREYKSKIDSLRSKYNDIGLSECEFDHLLLDCVNELHEDNQNEWKKVIHYVKSHPSLKIVLFIIFMYLLNLAFSEKPFNLLLCQIQDFIYPGLRLLRIVAIPVLSNFPTLSELYDETCLLPNPYFYVADLDCWVCKDIKKVEEYTSLEYPVNTMPPFIYKIQQTNINFTTLMEVYNSNKDIFDKDAPKIIVNGHTPLPINEFFIDLKVKDKSTAVGNNYLWKFTRLLPIQIIKQYFPRPKIIPHLGLATERYISIDEPGSKPNSLPDTECNYVFVIQSQGERLIQLKPAIECAKDCNSMYIKLKPSFLLWYNWWYWRPVSQEVLNNDTSISYIGSYC